MNLQPHFMDEIIIIKIKLYKKNQVNENLLSHLIYKVNKQFFIHIFRGHLQEGISI